MHGSLLLSGSESERRALKEDRGRENEGERIFSNGLLGTAASASDEDEDRLERASESSANIDKNDGVKRDRDGEGGIKI